MDSQNDNAYRNCFLCLFFCTALGIWFFIQIIKNRRKLNRNMEQIGDQLKMMEERIRQNIGNTNDEVSDVSGQHPDNSELGLVDLLRQLMVVDSMSYLLLAGVAWILIKLVYACFWLPKHLKKELEEEEMKRKLEEQGEFKSQEEEKEEPVKDKKND